MHGWFRLAAASASVQTFLSCPINHALATASDFFEQFVIAEIFQHPRNCWFKRLVIFVVE